MRWISFVSGTANFTFCHKIIIKKNCAIWGSGIANLCTLFKQTLYSGPSVLKIAHSNNNKRKDKNANMMAFKKNKLYQYKYTKYTKNEIIEMCHHTSDINQLSSAQLWSIWITVYVFDAEMQSFSLTVYNCANSMAFAIPRKSTFNKIVLSHFNEGNVFVAIISRNHINTSAK